MASLARTVPSLARTVPSLARTVLKPSVLQQRGTRRQRQLVVTDGSPRIYFFSQGMIRFTQNPKKSAPTLMDISMTPWANKMYTE